MSYFYNRVRNDLTAAWRVSGDPRVVSYLAITAGVRWYMAPEYLDPHRKPSGGCMGGGRDVRGVAA
jgi:hypothetical protein